MSLGINLFDKVNVRLNYEETRALVSQIQRKEYDQIPSQNFNAADRITRTGQMIMRMMTTDPDQKYIEDHYESESDEIVARYYFSSTTNELIKTYLMMRWNFQT